MRSRSSENFFHEVPGFLNYCFYVLTFTSQFSFLFWICINSTITENDIFAYFRHFSFNLDLFSHFDNIQKLGIEVDGNSSIGTHSENTYSRDDINHSCKGSSMNSGLDISMMIWEDIFK